MLFCNYGCFRLLTTYCLVVLFFIFIITNHQRPFILLYPATEQGIVNSTLGFAAILAINVPWRTDRKDSLMLAAAYSGISLEWINGINASQIDERAYPQGNHRLLSRASRGAWRAHMNAIRAVIEKNLSTALIIEDDVDWNPRIREQLQAFGRASRNLPDTIERADITAQNYIQTRDYTAQQDSVHDPMARAKRSTLLLPTTSYTHPSNPYGEDKWDVLWLGHCRNSLPPKGNSSAPNSPPDHFMLHDDNTVPDTDTTQIPGYAPRTRFYHRSHAIHCIHAYAVSQRGARKIMYEHGIRNFDKDYDSALSEWCDGLTKNMGDRPMCLTSSPSIFGHYELWRDSKDEDKAGDEGDVSLVESVREGLGEGTDGVIL